MPGLAEPEVGGTLGRDHRPWDAQPDDAVDLRAVAAVLDGDLIAEEPRRACAGVGDQCLVLVESQLEVLAQEPGKTVPDLLCFGLRSGEPEEAIVGVAHLPQPPAPTTTRIPRGQAPLLLAQ